MDTPPAPMFGLREFFGYRDDPFNRNLWVYRDRENKFELREIR